MSHEIEQTLFEPGSEVAIHELEKVRVEEGGKIQPFPAPIARATVKKDGSLEVDGLDPGQYTASAAVHEDALATPENIDLQVADVDEYRYVTFTVTGG